MRCWAYGPQGQRCMLDALSHYDADGDDNHGFTVKWTDDECLDPASALALQRVPVGPPARLLTHSVSQTAGVAEEGELIGEHGAMVVPGEVVEVDEEAPCAICGCSAYMHLDEDEDGEKSCAMHDCKTFLA